MSKRLKFFLSHLLLSFLVALLVVGLVFFIWYPSTLATAVGVTHIFLMLLVIDVILGPVLGLLVYKEGKKTLKFDISVIILIQIAALCYGVYSIEQGRPVWIAYNVDRFELVRKNELITEHLDQAKTLYQKPSFLSPQYVSVEFAKDKLQRQNDMFAEALGGISIAQKPERYVDFTKALPQIKKHAILVSELEQFNDYEQVREVLAKYPQANGYVPLKANAVDMTVLVNKETGEVLKIVDLRPWK
ncbi:type IV pilin accessory protein [Acinetobacter sp. ANC 7200]|uniref:TfpX/TfpZ family type IV pilin accessory protein n=1 Tax=Acinetobacter amyesii TaxID=2942470 RepID=UPI0020BD4D12|nr:TfpX/TfpZ family type IV pilin accessory protein [Acinetobacter amyesii]MCL6244180.1 type IV pilin accessory protein [Acinetobacter amyesii]